MIFRNFSFLFLVFLRVKGNIFHGEKKWQPLSWEDLNKEWQENFVNQNQVFGMRNEGNFSADYKADHDDPEVYSSGFESFF